MYFVAKIKQNIFIPSTYFDGKIKKRIISSLISTVEGTKSGPFGTIIIVIGISEFRNNGKILPGSSSALYNLNYKAITFRVFKGEVLDSILTNITRLGFFCESGFLQIFVSKQFIPNNYFYDDLNKCFQNKINENDKIKKDVVIRVRIIGLREESSQLQAIGSINENFLGKKI
nr:RNA polymerase II RPB7 subunit-like protein [Cryptomonas curvata]